MKSKPLRIPKEFQDILDDGITQRVKNGLDKKTMSYPEGIKRFMNCPSFSKAYMEFCTLPKKEDIKNI